jgi:hypothetical protein
MTRGPDDIAPETPALEDESTDLPGDPAGETIVGATLEALKLATVEVEGERDLAETLQRSLLPQLPEVPGLAIAAKYRPGSAGTRVGGDWYDAIRLRTGSVGLGHRWPAPSDRGRGRRGWRTCERGPGPFQALRPAVVVPERMNGFVVEASGEGMLTPYTRSSTRVRARATASAAPPPLVLRPDQEPALPRDPPSSPLGVAGLYERDPVP